MRLRQLPGQSPLRETGLFVHWISHFVPPVGPIHQWISPCQGAMMWMTASITKKCRIPYFFFAHFHRRCRHLCQPPPQWVLRNYRCLKMAMTVMMRKPLCCRQISGAFATQLQSMPFVTHSSILGSNHHRKQPPKKWNEEEDERLRSAVQKYGEAKWKDIAKYIPYERLLPPRLLHCFVCTCRNT